MPKTALIYLTLVLIGALIVAGETRGMERPRDTQEELPPSQSVYNTPYPVPGSDISPDYQAWWELYQDSNQNLDNCKEKRKNKPSFHYHYFVALLGYPLKEDFNFQALKLLLSDPYNGTIDLQTQTFICVENYI